MRVQNKAHRQIRPCHMLSVTRTIEILMEALACCAGQGVGCGQWHVSHYGRSSLPAYHTDWGHAGEAKNRGLQLAQCHFTGRGPEGIAFPQSASVEHLVKADKAQIVFGPVFCLNASS